MKCPLLRELSNVDVSKTVIASVFFIFLSPIFIIYKFTGLIKPQALVKTTLTSQLIKTTWSSKPNKAQRVIPEVHQVISRKSSLSLKTKCNCINCFGATKRANEESKTCATFFFYWMVIFLVWALGLSSFGIDIFNIPSLNSDTIFSTSPSLGIETTCEK
jgi:predicted membrane-bound mannosyltransferase